MLTTNLLSSEDKKIIGLVKIARAARVIALVAVGLIVANAVFVLPTLLPLALERKESVRELATGKEAQEKFRVSEQTRELKALAASIREIRVFVSKPRLVSKTIDSLLNAEIPGISLGTVTVTQTGDTVITGQSATRGALLEFESLLKRSPYFEEISSPLSNIIRESNINFSIKGKVKPDILDNL